VHETRRRVVSGPSGGPIGARRHEEPLDDWLGDISDDDWGENATQSAQRRDATPASQERPVPEDVWGRSRAELQAGPPGTADAHRAIVARRRLVAGVVVTILVALALATATLLVRAHDQAPEAPVREAAAAAPTEAETRPSRTPTSPASTSSTTPASILPSTASAVTFTLPEGTKLQRVNAGPAVITDLEPITDPEVVAKLQQALSSAGFDPGEPDGTFGQRTEAAVIAFQQANGLSPDGIVGPDTASALNGVVTGG
jgi:murein L,D-transpeptidase YcbB/YkuD